ncbi:MAG: DUF4271 domain-containing protein [Saprospiraceae bacterium]|nr:MAG: DUF4271 domain-containing protein [Saprospiraceae bacterium]
MVPRLKEGPKVETPSASKVVEQGNPFDLHRNKETPSSFRPKPVATPKVVAKPRPIESNSTAYDSFLFSVMMVCLILLAVLLTLFRSLYSKISRAIFSDTMLNQLYRENPGMKISFIFLYSFFFINLSVFIFLLLRHYGITDNNTYWQFLGQIILGVSSLFTLKHVVLSLIAYIFPVEKEARLYSFTIMIFSIILGLILAPMNLFLAYTPPLITQTLLYFTFAIIVGIYGLRTLRGLFMTNKYLLFHKFHFLLYICTIEIAPVLVLAKLIIKQLQG